MSHPAWRGGGSMTQAELPGSNPKPAFGTPAPWFKGRVLDGNPQYTFHTVAGRVVVLYFMGSADRPVVKSALDVLMQAADRFDDRQSCFFGITHDPEDETAGRVKTRMPGIRYVMDADRSISTAYGACGTQSTGYDPYVAVLDR